MNKWYLAMLAPLALLAGCAHDPVVRGFDQDSARAFILGKVGNQAPSGVRLEKHYKENFTKTTDTEFICNRSDRLERVTNYTVTRNEGNYIEINASHVEDCDNSVTRYRLNGWYNNKYLYLRTADRPTTYVYVMEIADQGRLLTDIGNYRYVDGQLQWQAHVRNGEKRSTGGYYYTTGYVAQGDTSEASAEQGNLLTRSQQARREEPSTASQIALFGSLMASQMNQQAATRAAEAAAAQERQRQLRAAAAETSRRNEQLMAAAAASRQQPVRDLGSPPSAPRPLASTGLAASTTASEGPRGLTTVAQDRVARENAEEERRRAEKQAAQKAAMEKAAAEKAAAEKAAAEKAAAEARKAKWEADKKAEAEAKARAEADYLRQLAAGTRLTVKNCYGEQHAMGVLPRIKPEAVACVDLHFRAYCPGNHPSQAYEGAIKNMVGMGTGCFGDTAQITPKLGCQAEAIRVEVVRASPCS